MSHAYGALLDRAAASPLAHSQQPLAGANGQQPPGSSSSYVGVHRRRDGQGLDPDVTERRPGHRPRHRRPR